jgi:hypothetical protein
MGIKDIIEELFESIGLSYNFFYILLLILYISIISVYTPRTFLALMNNLYIKIFILLYIFYVVCIETDIILGMFLLVAFVVTINLDNSIQVAKQIAPRESFENSDDTTGDTSDNEDVIEIKLPKKTTSSSASKDKREEYRNSPPAGAKNTKSSGPSGPRHESEFVNDEEDEEHYQEMMQDQALRDTFQNLHYAIHELQTMVKK